MLLFAILFLSVAAAAAAVADEPKGEDLPVENRIVNPHNFGYIYNPGDRVCKNQRVNILVYVHSAPKHNYRREAIRDTWASRYAFPENRIVFMLGDTSQQRVKQMLSLEYEKYGDLVQENFIDHYTNLTYKGVMAMKWITEYCPNARIILKTDDDVVVNMFRLLNLINTNYSSQAMWTRKIFCATFAYQMVIRNKEFAQYVSRDVFPGEYFNQYCSGCAFIISPDLPPLIYNISAYIRYINIDDYYITGAAVRPFNVTYDKLTSFYLYDEEELTKLENKEILVKDFLFANTNPGSVASGIYFKIWNIILSAFNLDFY